MNEIRGDHFIRGVLQNSLQIGFRGFFHRLADLLVGGVFAGPNCKVHHADRRRRNTEGHAGQFSLNFRAYETDGFGGACGGGDDVNGGRAATFPIFSRRAIDSFLCGCVAVHSSHQSFLNAETFFQENMNEWG